MVNVDRFEVDIKTVSEALYQHPSVLMAAAFGVPDPDTPGSERVMAVIPLKSEYRDQTSEDEIRDFCREHLSV